MALFIPNCFSGEKLSSQFSRYIQDSLYVGDIRRAIESSTAATTSVIAAASALSIVEHRRAIEDGSRLVAGSLEKGFARLESQAAALNSALDWRLALSIDQQRIGNLLAKNIADLLRIPEFEKERRHFIEEGLRFDRNAAVNPEFYADALDYLNRALRLKKQDYFVLHRLGLIELYAKDQSFRDPPKAEEHFRRAGKYAEVETDPRALSLANILAGRVDQPLDQQERPALDAIRRLAADSYFHAAVACLAQEKFTDSAALASRAYELGRNDEARYLHAKALFFAGSSPEIPVLLTEVISNNPQEYAMRAVLDFSGHPEIVLVLERVRASIFERVGRVLDSCKLAVIPGSAAILLLAQAEAAIARNTLIDAADASMLLNGRVEIGDEPFASLEDYTLSERRIFDAVRERLNRMKKEIRFDSVLRRTVQEIESSLETPGIPELHMTQMRLEMAIADRKVRAEQELPEIGKAIAESLEMLRRIEKKHDAMQTVLSRLEALIAERIAEEEVQSRKWIFKNQSRIKDLNRQIERLAKGDPDKFMAKCLQVQQQIQQLRNQLEAKQHTLAECQKEAELTVWEPLPTATEPAESAVAKQKCLAKLGHDASTNPVVVDLAGLGHILVAGANQRDCNEFVSGLLLSLFSRFAPNQMRWLVIDTALSKLSSFAQSPHSIAPVITDEETALASLRWAAREIKLRADMLNEIGRPRLDQLSRLLIIVSDTVELIPKVTELHLNLLRSLLHVRTTQLGVQVLFIVRTPITETVTHLANEFQTRIALRVGSPADSRTILAAPGAEELSEGELLYLLPGESPLFRCLIDRPAPERWQRFSDFLKEIEPFQKLPKRVETKISMSGEAFGLRVEETELPLAWESST